MLLAFNWFDLRFPSLALRAEGEDIEDECRTVDHPAVERTLEVALLGRNVVIEITMSPPSSDQRSDFLCLASANERRRIGRLTTPWIAPTTTAPTASPQADFGKTSSMPLAEISLHQYGAVTR